jgi:hypothetical protein
MMAVLRNTLWMWGGTVEVSEDLPPSIERAA